MASLAPRPPPTHAGLARRRGPSVLIVLCFGLSAATSCFTGREYYLDVSTGEATSDPEPVCDSLNCVETCCGSSCANLQEDPAHCGTCDHPCTRFERCIAGDCVCTRDCDNRVCGNDGCGGSCGECSDGQACAVGEESSQCIDASIGCADATREGLSDRTMFPDIAACAAQWAQQNLREQRTGVACGNDLSNTCGAPEDACAEGWHICMRNGQPQDLASRIDGSVCTTAVAGNGAFVAASDFDDGSGTCGPPFSCGTGRRALCCGTACRTAAVDCLWPETFGPVIDSVCDAVSGSTGVLCCRDPALP